MLRDRNRYKYKIQIQNAKRTRIFRQKLIDFFVGMVGKAFNGLKTRFDGLSVWLFSLR